MVTKKIKLAAVTCTKYVVRVVRRYRTNPMNPRNFEIVVEEASSGDDYYPNADDIRRTATLGFMRVGIYSTKFVGYDGRERVLFGEPEPLGPLVVVGSATWDTSDAAWPEEPHFTNRIMEILLQCEYRRNCFGKGSVVPYTKK